MAGDANGTLSFFFTRGPAKQLVLKEDVPLRTAFPLLHALGEAVYQASPVRPRQRLELQPWTLHFQLQNSQLQLVPLCGMCKWHIDNHCVVVFRVL